MGFPDDAPYNAIHVGAASPVLPQAVSDFHIYKIFYKFFVLPCILVLKKLNLTKIFESMFQSASLVPTPIWE